MRVLWVALAIVVTDQLTKWAAVEWLAYGHMANFGRSVPVLGDWLKLTYTTNPGMAWGLELGPPGFLAIFSLLATVAILGYLWVVRRGPFGYRLALAVIVGGAVGNVIDRTLYGVIYGVAPLFQGEVVDFLHLDLWRGTLPESWPLVGGDYLALFPIGNVADLAVMGGVGAILLFQGRFHRALAEQQEAEREAKAALDAPPAPVPPGLDVDVVVPSPPLPAAPPPVERPAEG